MYSHRQLYTSVLHKAHTSLTSRGNCLVARRFRADDADGDANGVAASVVAWRLPDDEPPAAALPAAALPPEPRPGEPAARNAAPCHSATRVRTAALSPASARDVFRAAAISAAALARTAFCSLSKCSSSKSSRSRSASPSSHTHVWWRYSIYSPLLLALQSVAPTAGAAIPSRRKYPHTAHSQTMRSGDTPSHRMQRHNSVMHSDSKHGQKAGRLPPNQKPALSQTQQLLPNTT